MSGPSPSVPLPTEGRGKFISGLREFLWVFRNPIPLLVVAAFVTALFWAQARDPFRRIEFSVKTSSGKIKGIAVLPRKAESGKRESGNHSSFPVVVYLHGSGGSLLTSGKELRLIAEQGIAAVGLEYNQTNQAAFDEEFRGLHRYLAKQKWAGGVSGHRPDATPTTAVAWIGASLGAQRQLSFLLRNPEFSPQLLVRLSGGLVQELGASQPGLQSSDLRTNIPSSIDHPVFSSLQTLLVHGENDEVFPVADCRKLAELLRTNGLAADLRIFPGQSHRFGADRSVIMRGIAEYCANFFNTRSSNAGGSLNPLPLNIRRLHLHYWIPFVLLCGFILVSKYVRWRKSVMHIPRGKFGAVVLCLAWVVGIVAIAETTLRLGLPRLEVTESRLNLARGWLVEPKLKGDFDWLAQKPIWAGQTIIALLEHLQLAEYNFQLINWTYDEPIYRDFVLSPVIEIRRTADENSPADMNWRRPLWENFYPRIRREHDPISAAQIVVRFLRERVTVVPQNRPEHGIRTIWETGLADAAGFERIYVAALRSTGIAARLDQAGHAELLVDSKWHPAPRPLVMSFLNAENEQP